MHIDFDAEGAKKAFQAVHRAHVHDHGKEYEAREAFLSRFTWEPIDGQHIRSTCVDIATKDLEAGMLTAEEYELVFKRWKVQVLLYDEP